MILAARGPDPAGLEGGRGAVPISPRRLGFAVKIAGRPDLKDHDSRRWQNGPHLRVSLHYLDQIFAYLAEHGIRMFRISSDIATYITHPDPSSITRSRNAETASPLLGSRRVR